MLPIIKRFWFKQGKCYFILTRTKWINCRLTTKYPDYQLSWDILAECRQQDANKHNFYFVYWKFSQPYLLHNHRTTVPSLCSSLPASKAFAIGTSKNYCPRWIKVKNAKHVWVKHFTLRQTTKPSLHQIGGSGTRGALKQKSWVGTKKRVA